MNTAHSSGRDVLLFAAMLWLVGFAPLPTAHAQPAKPQTEEIRIAEIEGVVELLTVGSTRWVRTQTNEVLRAGDRLRSAVNSRVTLRWSDSSVVPFGALTEIEIMPVEAQSGLRLIRG